MRQKVTVLSVKGQETKVYYDRPTACAGDCDHCHGCSGTAAKERVQVIAQNSIGAKPGDQVYIEAASRAVFGAIALVYVLPLVLFFLGYALGTALDIAAAAFGCGGFGLGIGAAVLVNRMMVKKNREIRFEITGFAEES